MYQRFFATFGAPPSPPPAASIWTEPRLTATEGYQTFASVAAGHTFGDGLYRVHDATTGPLATAWISTAFPEYQARVSVFAFDWMGRQFALDFGRLRGAQPLVLILDPGFVEALEVPTTFVEFHNDELVDHTDAALLSEFYTSWRRSSGVVVALTTDQCVGYRVPVFLGGPDTEENLEVTDLDVYWHLSTQLHAATQGLADGAVIDGVHLEE